MIVDKVSEIVVAAEQILLDRDAHIVPHSRWSLHQHLVNTHNISESWGQPTNVRLASLMHSVYSTDAFTTAIVPLSDRKVVSSVIGEQAERLVFLFCSIDRQELFSFAIRGDNEMYPANLKDRNGIGTHSLSRSEIRDLLMIHAANVCEQTNYAAASSGGRLSKLIELIDCAVRLGASAPPWFEAGRTSLSLQVENELLESYRRSQSALFKGSIDSLYCLDLGGSFVGEPSVIMAFRKLLHGESRDAISYAARARSLLSQWGTPYDKSLSLLQWVRLCDFVIDVSGMPESSKLFITRCMSKMSFYSISNPRELYSYLDSVGLLATAFETPPSRDDDDFDPAKRCEVPARFLKYLASFNSARDHREFGSYPDLPSRPWYSERLELTDELEEKSNLIIEEFKRSADLGFHTQSETGVARDGKWDVCILYERGNRRPENLSRFPVLAQILESHNVIKGLAGLVYFSRLGPQTQIAPHTGPTNLRLRCHLGIIIPENCGIMVHGVSQTWREGKCLVFDDSFVHSAWNASEAERIVLVVDIWHPNLSSTELDLLQGLHRYVDLQSRNLTRYWQANERARVEQ